MRPPRQRHIRSIEDATWHAVIYARVSDDEQRNHRSVGQQEEEGREAAEDRSWVVDEVFVDNDRSASRFATKERESHKLLLAYLAEKAVDVLILWESSRGDRDLERWAALLNLCRRRGIKMHVVTHDRTYDLDRARDWRSLAEDGIDSAYEVEKTRDRILRSVRNNARAGRPHGKLLYGYRRVYDARGNFLEQVEHEDQAEIVREIVRRVQAGDALYKIAQDLRRREVPTPREGLQGWLPYNVRRIALNPAYAGHRVHKGNIVGAAVWPALVEEDAHQDCVSLLGNPDRKTTRGGQARRLLSGVVRCAHCGAACFSQQAPRRAAGMMALTCRGEFCLSALEEPIDAFITEMVLKRLSRRDFERMYAARGQVAAAVVETELAKLTARLDGFYESAAAGKLSPEGLARVEEQLLPQIADAKQRASEAKPMPALLRVAAGPRAREVWGGFGVDQRRQVVRLLAVVKLSRVGAGRRQFRPEERLPESQWVGDERTWGELWAAEGVAI